MSTVPGDSGGILAHVPPSAEQKPAVEADGRDVVVTAGAGTGKTRTLVARYLRLLEGGVPPRRIAAITFTKKAAREMRNRVREAIRDHLRTEGLDPSVQDYWRDLYTELDAARIGTIHGLCTEILRAHPAEAELDPRFEVLDEVQSALVSVEAVESAMAWAAEDESASHWFDHLGDRALRSLLDSLLRNRADVDEAFRSIGDDPLAHWRDVLDSEQQASLRALLDDPEWLNAVAVLEHFAADNPADTFDIRRRAALAAIQGIETDLDIARRDIGGINLGVGGSSIKNWPGGKDDLDEVKSSLKYVRTAWTDAKVLALSLCSADETLAADLPSLLAIFDHMVGALEGLKRERNVLDFDDLETMARDLLSKREDVRLRWNDELHAVMVDEFQDTNARQQAIVGNLVPKGRRFYVGDAKQSIYRFRGAVVTGMRTIRREVEADDGVCCALSRSYRSHDALVRAQNALLAPVLGVEEDPTKPFVEPFSKLEAERKSPPEGMLGPFIELHLAPGSKGGGSLKRAAEALTDRLIGLVEDSRIMIDHADGSSRGLGYGDIAILCRASSSFGEYEEALGRAGVPYVTVSGRGYYDRPEIRDLLNAMRAIADPHDDLSLVGLLRSPAFAVSDPGIYRLCYERAGLVNAGTSRSLWDHLSGAVIAMSGGTVGRSPGRNEDSAGGLPEAAAGLSPGARAGGNDLGPYSALDLERLDRAWHAVNRLRALAGRVTVGELLDAILDGTAYVAMLRLAGDHRAARNVEKLLDEARESRLVGVGDFVEWVASISAAETREGEARALAEGMVRIQTIHSAKGLEFPIVALGDVAKAPGGSRGGLLIDRELGVLPRLEDESEEVAAVYQLAGLRDSERAEAESRRLLYVAVTRAKDMVLLSGTAERKRDGELGKLGGWLGTLAEVLGLDGLDAQSIDPESSTPVSRSLRSVVEASATIYPEGFVAQRTATALPSLAITAEASNRGSLFEAIERQPARLLADVDALEARRDPPRRVWRVVPDEGRRTRAPAWVVGTLVHKAIERRRLPGEDPTLREWLVAITNELGIIDPDEADAAVVRTISLLDRFADHPLCSALERAERRLHEVPFVGEGAGGRLHEGRIDLLYLLDGRWTVVDFKADEVRGHNLDDFKVTLQDPIDGYIRQVTGYADAVKSLMGGAPPRALLCLLDFEGGVRLCEVRDGASVDEILESSPEP